jgi:hypothetical protein
LWYQHREVVEVVAGTSALEQESGAGGGDVAASRRTIRACKDRWLGGGGDDDVAAALRVCVERWGGGGGEEVVGISAPEREGGGGGDVAWSRGTLSARSERWLGRGGDEEVAGTIHLREERWEGGGGGEEVPSPPRSSGRVVKVEAMWPGRDEPFAFVWGGGKVVEVAETLPIRAGGWCRG